MKLCLIERSYLDTQKQSFKALCHTLQVFREDNHHVEAIIYASRWFTLHHMADRAECVLKLMMLEGHNPVQEYTSGIRKDLLAHAKVFLNGEQFEEFRMCF
jgi:hypothetical protein